MEYRLMHKDIVVAEITLDSATCSIIKIGNLNEASHLPVGVTVKKGEANRTALNEWWSNRSIPTSRQGIRNALQDLNVATPQALLDKSLGLSLSDQYWICPKDSPLTWSKVNFFENSFSDDVGNILFGKDTQSDVISLMSPDNTSDGWLRKKWTIINGKRSLVKGGSGANQQEPYNEVIASAIMRRLGIPHVPYTLTMLDGYPFSVCEDFVTPHTELISAWYIMQTQKKENHVSVYQHYSNCCEALGIADISEHLDYMIIVDYLIANEDRHQNNFGVLRNADTLQWLGAAPIYDSGSSLWFTSPVSMISAAGKLSSKPFKTTHDEQIKLVTSFDWVDLNALEGMDDEIREIVNDSPFIDDLRCDAICNAFNKRIEMLSAAMCSSKKYSAVADLSEEIKEDISYSSDDEQER